MRSLVGSVVQLRIEDVSHLRLNWIGGPTQRSIRAYLRKYPDLGFWDPSNGEYILGGPWRHRDEVVTVVESNGANSTRQLHEALIEQTRSRGARLFLISEFGESRRPEFYRNLQMEALEEIIVYERPLPSTVNAPADWLRFQRLNPKGDPTLEQLIDVDHQAFPWLWWNSCDEFLDYLDAPGVVIQSGWIDSEIACYVGTTGLRGWGHLDRIAVAPKFQGKGVGRLALEHAMRTLIGSGAKRIALSTQSTNAVSRSLYESVHFQRSSRHDYRIYGRWLAAPPQDKG